MTSQDENLPRLDGPAPGVELKAAPDDGRPDFNSFIAPSIEIRDPVGPRVTEVGEDGAEIQSAPREPELISEDEFFELFCMAWDLPQMADPRLAPLAIGLDRRDKARIASNSSYVLAKIYGPTILYRRQTPFEHIVIVAMFLKGQVEIARACLAKPVPGPGPEFKTRRNEEGGEDDGL